MTAQVIRSENTVALKAFSGDYDIFAQQVIAESTNASAHAIEVSGGSSTSQRNISIQRADAQGGAAISVSGNGRVVIECMNAFSESNHAVTADSVLQVIRVCYAQSRGALPALRLDSGGVEIQHLSQSGTGTHAAEIGALTRLTADFVRPSLPLNTIDGIKVFGAELKADAPTIDVGQIVNIGKAIVADGTPPQYVFAIRDYRSKEANSAAISVETPNHPT